MQQNKQKQIVIKDIVKKAKELDQTYFDLNSLYLDKTSKLIKLEEVAVLENELATLVYESAQLKGY